MLYEVITGKKADLTYKMLFLTFIVIGAAASMGSIWDFSDAMIFAMVVITSYSIHYTKLYDNNFFVDEG